MEASSKEDEILDVAIIGAGFGGLAMAIALKKAKRTAFRVFEKAPDLGGTWLFNRYPGIACDIPSFLYSFSFAQNPDWSRSYSSGAEIWRYMKRVADDNELYPYLQFNSPVSSAQYDEIARLWRVTLGAGETVWARTVVTGTGALHVPSLPDIKGLEDFEGPKFHSAEWDERFDPVGKTVAVIGTGASAIQIVPSIAGKARQIYLFQRTPAWIVPRFDRPTSAVAKAFFRHVPLLQTLYRAFVYTRMELRAIAFTVWPLLMKQLEKPARAYLDAAVLDPELRAALTPSYRIGCKRVLVSDDFYPAMNRKDVMLVTSPIERIEQDSIVTADGVRRPVDAIVTATGFRVTDWLPGVTVIGRGGRDLTAEWRNGGAARAYYGITAEGFPNLFMLLGPNTGLGHNSIIFMIEAQTRYIMRCLKWLWSGEADSVEVRADVQRSFNAWLNARMRRTVWLTGCRSWYLNPDGTNSTIWPSFTLSYWWYTHSAHKGDFVLSLKKQPCELHLGALP
ncbi:MAG: NAD(P)/FAD-dependent oxidoreductase [Alphaproteobacteria bacterium]|nr:NAD(P)/FAD-dependent oxidoreductase [Alphaproteobacteria bacterium]